MQKFNWKYWISTVAGIALTIGMVAAQAGDQGLVDKENKNYKWLMLVIGSGGAINLFLTGASNSRPWLPGDGKGEPPA